MTALAVPALIVTLAVAISALAIAPLHVVLLLFATLAWYAVPGYWLARRCYAHQERGSAIAWLVGPLWGYLLSNLFLLGLWWIGLRHPLAVLLAPLPALGAVHLLAPRTGVLVPPTLTRRDIAAVLLVLCFVPVIVGRPFSQVGRQLAEGTAYRAYFTADFIWARTVVVELAKAERPPQNMFLRGDPLNYYWLSHLLSAMEYRWNASALTVDRILLVNALGLGLVFVAFLYGFIRHFANSPPAAAVGCAFALAFASLEATWFLRRLWQQGQPLDIILSYNVDGISRWVLGSVVVDGLHRLLLYQVTHHAVAYGAALSALVAVVASPDPARPGVAWLTGLLLGGALLFSSFSALMIGVAVGGCYVARLIASRQGRRLPGVSIRAAIPIAGAVGISIALHYVDAGGGLVRFGLNQVAARNASRVVPLSFGVLLPAGLLGIAVGVATRHWRTLALALLAAVCFTFYFFVNVLDHLDTYVAFRSGHVIIITFGTLLAVFAEWIWTRSRPTRVAAAACALVAAALATPTALFDIINCQDVFNRKPGPGFRWTVILSPGEVEGMTWIREHTRPDAIVQVEPFARGRDTWSYVTAFGERRMAAGLPISMVPLAKYERASERIREIYRATEPGDAYLMAGRERIDYLVIGPPERRSYPAFQPTIESRPDLFVRVFGNGDLSIYRIRGTRP
ncbi:MAG TPA: hypothetical protein VHJ77_17590 [Vicinamibacterales bacterium]|jgi:hypothetical protein|nr:hypothetical protein [Vicinamibacterales bacterium]